MMRACLYNTCIFGQLLEYIKQKDDDQNPCIINDIIAVFFYKDETINGYSKNYE